ncbi:1,4-beta-N-acetylmuramidase [Weissella sagaensis]|uniref:1,4-beta-N-acetylmuramidase n=1 Tax=Weissella sagaensis TaxID=2559928 RepID=A0ABW1RVF0_9LACO|nr:1,4-beta-N-acetylmuramidase [Weissella sagaensis]KAA8434472.1 1,4-beta-N-acetylmuramidase [Weissella paramesenteroides]QDJ59633.1 1,4-beta-N-acetylmuramidase [Weissella hellenica]KAA8437431.1 1,4-beta-N-acetylmuramidase [Weissella paramesenteroides]QEA56946.1 1,4-beta-N-acetylmuramidase [Weissella hellenica]UEG67761.1 1,4-beta-N-acetylmuramidase [Weissella hellenica]
MKMQRFSKASLVSALVGGAVLSGLAITTTPVFADTSESTVQTTRMQQDTRTGYVYSPEVSTANGGYNWLENGRPYTGLRYYAGSYYWFVNGVRQNNQWEHAYGLTYYVDNNGRAVQGYQWINGQAYDFGSDNTFYLRKEVPNGYLNIEGVGWRWIENGQLYTGFKNHDNGFFYYEGGILQTNSWVSAYGHTYYVENDGRAVQGYHYIDGHMYYFSKDNTYYLRYQLPDE